MGQTLFRKPPECPARRTLKREALALPRGWDGLQDVVPAHQCQAGMEALRSQPKPGRDLGLTGTADDKQR